MEFSVEEAKAFAQRGRTGEWVRAFLLDYGKNPGLAQGLSKERRYWIGPRKMALSSLCRSCGPEEGMQYREEAQRWEGKIGRISQGMDSGWQMPPLIVHASGGKHVIADGNHRCEALRRAGASDAWALIWYDSVEELVEENPALPAAFFITGTSGAGKTTLVHALKERLPFARVHDFDEGGVPEGADERWRRQRTREWLRKAQEHAAAGVPTVVCGVCVPSEIKDSPEYASSPPVHYGIIVVSEEEIRRRLRGRGWDEASVAANINWAAHLEAAVRAEPGSVAVDGNSDPERVAREFAMWVIRETVMMPSLGEQGQEG